MTENETSATEEHVPQAFSFGMRYRREPHPTLRNVDVDGWLEIHGCAPMVARELMNRITNQAWAFQYDAPDIRRNTAWPNGPFLIIRADSEGRIEEFKYTNQGERS